jgi:uncharacterized protein (UPF0261 family)
MAIALLGTVDTKGPEIAFLGDCLQAAGRPALVIDVGLFDPQGIAPDISRHDVAAAGEADIASLAGRPRDEIVATMGRGAGAILRGLHAAGRLEGALGVGGNQGTAIVCTAMRELPLGFPKVVVSTIASGNVRPYVGFSDIAMLFSVTDVLGGPNRVSEPILRNAAAAVVGMCGAAAPGTPQPSEGPLVGVTALGNTHPAVTRAMAVLRSHGCEAAAFHASGAGGSALEQLIAAGRVAAVLDLTPHELTEEVVGAGWYRPVTPGRLTAAGRAAIPQVVAPGGMEYLCFGPRESVPQRFRRRPTVYHNPMNANVRTSRQEMAAIGQAMAERLNQAKGPVAVVIPLKGWSVYGAAGGPLHDPVADAAFVRSLTRFLRKDIPLQRLPLHINDPAFADRCCALLLEMLGSGTARS